MLRADESAASAPACVIAPETALLTALLPLTSAGIVPGANVVLGIFCARKFPVERGAFGKPGVAGEIAGTEPAGEIVPVGGSGVVEMPEGLRDATAGDTAGEPPGGGADDPAALAAKPLTTSGWANR